MIYGDYPQEIQDKIKERVEEQGNIYRPNTPSGSGKSNKGFTWDETHEGDRFWRNILLNHEYSIFYNLYPKKNKLELISIEPRTYIASLISKSNKKYKITIEEYED